MVIRKDGRWRYKDAGEKAAELYHESISGKNIPWRCCGTCLEREPGKIYSKGNGSYFWHVRSERMSIV